MLSGLPHGKFAARRHITNVLVISREMTIAAQKRIGLTEVIDADVTPLAFGDQSFVAIGRLGGSAELEL